MDRDLKIVRTQLLSGHGTLLKKNSLSPNTTLQSRYSPGGWYLPLFSQLPNQSMWIDKLYEHYKDDFEAFGYSYKVHGNGDVYATCLEFDSEGYCI